MMMIMHSTQEPVHFNTSLQPQYRALALKKIRVVAGCSSQHDRGPDAAASTSSTSTATAAAAEQQRQAVTAMPRTVVTIFVTLYAVPRTCCCQLLPYICCQGAASH
jgi:hypothetical protein